MILQEKVSRKDVQNFLETCFDTFCKSGLENTSYKSWRNPVV